MTAKKWAAKIRKASRDAGTYQRYFEHIVGTLAAILEMRDRAMEQFEAEGGQVLVTFTNKNGAENMVQNPALRMANDLNRDALAYWRDLGLTPAGLRKINDEALKKQTRAGVSALLERFEKSS